MPYSQETGGRGYPLPFVANFIENDVERIREALRRIDEDVLALVLAAEGTAPANHGHDVATCENPGFVRVATNAEALSGAGSDSVMTPAATTLLVKNSLAPAIASWKDFPGFVRLSDSSFAVEDTEENRSVFLPGRPIRYRATEGTWRYGMVDGYTSGNVTLFGVPLDADHADELQYGDINRVAVMYFNVPGRFAGSANSALLATVSNDPRWWEIAPAHLVQISHVVKTDDSGASQPKVTAVISGNNVGTDNSGAGLPVSESLTRTATGINPLCNRVIRGDVVEIATDAGGASGDSENLSGMLLFVLE
jgi:hypothetical protein